MSKWSPPEKPFITLSEQFPIAQSKQVCFPALSVTAIDVLIFHRGYNTNIKNNITAELLMNHLVRTPIS